jgi:hypothetical protein
MKLKLFTWYKWDEVTDYPVLLIRRKPGNNFNAYSMKTLAPGAQEGWYEIIVRAVPASGLPTSPTPNKNKLHKLIKFIWGRTL